MSCAEESSRTKLAASDDSARGLLQQLDYGVAACRCTVLSHAARRCIMLRCAPNSLNPTMRSMALPSMKHTIVGSTLTASCTHTHACTHAHARTRPCTHTHTRAHRRPRVHAPLTHTRALARRARVVAQHSRPTVHATARMARGMDDAARMLRGRNRAVQHADGIVRARVCAHARAFCTKKGAFSEFKYKNFTPRCRGAILRRCMSARTHACTHPHARIRMHARVCVHALACKRERIAASATADVDVGRITR